MPFKTVPSTLAQLQNFVSNLLPQKKSGAPISKPPWVIDPEICEPSFQTYITNAFAHVANLNTGITLLGGECGKLATCLAGKSVGSVYITCANCSEGARPSSSNASAGSIQLCLDAYGPTITQDIVNGLVFRELIRMCGGMELDAWALYCYFEFVTPGPPSPYYWPLPPAAKDWMCKGSTPGTGVLTGYRFGNYVVWDPYLGRLWARLLTGSGVGPVIISGGTMGVWQYMCPP
jgi:hypothetical protein